MIQELLSYSVCDQINIISHTQRIDSFSFYLSIDPSYIKNVQDICCAFDEDFYSALG
jgi:hypothetical protein